MLLTSSRRETKSRLAFGFVFAIAVATFTLSGLPWATAVVVFDDFSDLDDTANPTWSHLDGAAASTDQTWDASTGQYRMTAPGNSPGPGDLAGVGFVGSYVEPSFTDVRVTADIVDFIGPGFDSAIVSFAIAARLNGDNSPPTDNKFHLNGYSYQYEPSADDGNGEMVLNILHGDAFKDVRSQKVTLDPLKDYRVMLEVIGNLLHGTVREMVPEQSEDMWPVVAEAMRDLDAEPPDPDNYDGPLNPVRPFVPYTSGFSGVYAVGHIFFPVGQADLTIDNFKTESIGLAVDYNEDGTVNAADYTVWRDGGSPDDSQAGYDLWKANFGNSGSGSGSAAVPEPVSAALVVVGLIGLWVGRRRAG